MKSFPASLAGAENPDDGIGASDGSTGETELLTSALSKFSLHTDEAAIYPHLNYPRHREETQQYFDT